RGYRPSIATRADVQVVTVPVHTGGEHTVGELEELFEHEVAERQRLLHAREREVIERHLVEEVSAQLHERLRQGEELVRRMNAEIENRPMSTGMRLRFQWEPEPDGPEGLKEARRKLLATKATWSPQEREAVGRFLHRRIEEARDSGEGATWLEQLGRALDYRAWHRFVIERQQDGEWKPLTKRTHGTGSGGEKAIALTMPQLAAAAAHYGSAHEHAPRFILLDEAFVGIDGDMRGKCMALLAAFDLDFVMTSEREWGCYAGLPGLAIYQLSTQPGVEAIHTTRWVWNGRERVLDDGSAAVGAATW
ncbi:MAG: SbcC/MukB-like Walker B domain-containing protein, partial [Polyangiales bacterium]